MHAEPSIPDAAGQGAIGVGTHRVREARQGAYDTWLGEIGRMCRKFPGHLDWQIIRPVMFLLTYVVSADLHKAHPPVVV
jgi:antibiotic biosynthesis monooxygenase (ABM) superfamily enzyme